MWPKPRLCCHGLCGSFMISAMTRRRPFLDRTYRSRERATRQRKSDFNDPLGRFGCSDHDRIGGFCRLHIRRSGIRRAFGIPPWPDTADPARSQLARYGRRGGCCRDCDHCSVAVAAAIGRRRRRLSGSSRDPHRMAGGLMVCQLGSRSDMVSFEETLKCRFSFELF